MSRLYIDGVLFAGTPPQGWTDEDQEREETEGIRMHETEALCKGQPAVVESSLDALTAEATAAGFRPRLILTEGRDGLVWWADLYHPIRVARRHGYGPSATFALASALLAPEVAHDVPFATHTVAATREPPTPEPTVRRRF